MEGFFLSTFLAGLFGTVIGQLATAIAIWMFIPDGGWRDSVSLYSYIWEKHIPRWIRRLYLVGACFFALATISCVVLAFMGGQFIAILLAVVGMCVLIYELYRLWLDHYGEF